MAIAAGGMVSTAVWINANEDPPRATISASNVQSYMVASAGDLNFALIHVALSGLGAMHNPEIAIAQDRISHLMKNIFDV